eukprot:10358157-Alexandrium_andersonii.AAC.1
MLRWGTPQLLRYGRTAMTILRGSGWDLDDECETRALWINCKVYANSEIDAYYIVRHMKRVSSGDSYTVSRIQMFR